MKYAITNQSIWTGIYADQKGSWKQTNGEHFDTSLYWAPGQPQTPITGTTVYFKFYTVEGGETPGIYYFNTDKSTKLQYYCEKKLPSSSIKNNLNNIKRKNLFKNKLMRNKIF